MSPSHQAPAPGMPSQANQTKPINVLRLPFALRASAAAQAIHREGSLCFLIRMRMRPEQQGVKRRDCDACWILFSAAYLLGREGTRPQPRTPAQAKPCLSVLLCVPHHHGCISYVLRGCIRVRQCDKNYKES